MYAVDAAAVLTARDVAGAGDCHTDPMSGARIVKRWKTGLVELLRVTSPPLRPSRWTWTADAILAFVLAVCTAGHAWRQEGGSGFVLPFGAGASAPPPPVPPNPPPGPYFVQGLADLQPWQLALAALTALPLVVRRRWPLSALWLVLGSMLLFHRSAGAHDTTVYTFLSCVIAAYSAAVYSPYRAYVLVSLVAGACLIAVFHEENFPKITDGFIPFLLLLGVVLAANTIHTWKQRLRVLQEEHEAATRLAVDRERSRIARELHDVVTHNVSVMVIQAGAARKVMDTAPDLAAGRHSPKQRRYAVWRHGPGRGPSAPARVTHQ